MNRKLSFYIVMASLLFSFAACNSTVEDEELEDTTISNVMVTEFSLEKNDKILQNLDSVFFSIDLASSRIYNADSLPKGTVLGKVPVKITTPYVSVAEIRVPGVTTSDSLINYLDDPKDSVDFSHGPVSLKLVALDGVTTKTYTIQINVHRMEPDSLYWNQLAMRRLPDVFAAPRSQRTVEFDGAFYCMMSNGSETALVKSETPDFASYTLADGTIPANINVNTLTVGADALYVLDIDNNLYEYKSGQWSDTGAEMSHIYGYYSDKLLGVRRDAEGIFQHTTYPFTEESPVADDCPITGTSVSMLYATPWAAEPWMLVVGGATASGSLTGSTWAYDGKRWANVSITQMEPRSNVTLFSYYTYSTNSNWVTKQYPTLFALGGLDKNGRCDNTVYVSRDRGVHWTKGDELLQLPSYIQKVNNAQALVVNTVMGASRSASGWTEYPSLRLPAWWQIETFADSRISHLDTQWNCPFIYLYGGYTASGSLSDTIWRGVINRLSFKPLQ